MQQDPNIRLSHQKIFILFLFSLFIFQCHTVNALLVLSVLRKGKDLFQSRHNKCFDSYLAELLTAVLKRYNYAISRWFKYSMSGFSDMEGVRATM